MELAQPPLIAAASHTPGTNATFLGTFLIPAHKNLLRTKWNLQVSMEKGIDEVDKENLFLCCVVWMNSTKSGRITHVNNNLQQDSAASKGASAPAPN